MERLAVPKTSSHPEYMLEYSEKLKRTGKNYTGSLSKVRKGYVISSAEEEMRMLLDSHKACWRPRDTEAYADVFGKNGYYARQLTRTGLRIPRGWEDGRFERNARGDKCFPRIITVGNEQLGEVLVPEGKGRIIIDWYESGVPRTTEDMDWPHEPYIAHWLFDEHQDEITIDILAIRYERDERCLCFFAGYSTQPDSDSAFRPVRSVFTKKQREAAGGQVSMASNVSGGELSEAEDVRGQISFS